MNIVNSLNKPAENEYLNCIRCGLCLSVCPTYREHLTETASPRGRVALARKSLEGDLPLSYNLVEQMYSCFGCMACNDLCPVGIKPAELAFAMRNIQEEIHPVGWKKTLFGNLLPHPARTEKAFFPVHIYEHSGLRRLFYALGLMRLLPAQVRDIEAMLPRIPQHPLRSVLPEITLPRGSEKFRLGFFLGCAQSLLFADQSAATVRVLARNGCTVVTPRQVECCGMPARGYGRIDLVRKQAKHNIQIFENACVTTIITDCATCGSALKDYGELLKDDPEWSERAAGFSAQVRDVCEFLAEIPLEKPKGHLNARVTYHDPCHLRRGQKVWQQPRELLKLIDGLDFVELPEADWCCGSAGSQLITHYKTSIQVMQRKLNNIASTNAQVVASGCPGCQMQLNTAMQRGKLKVRVVHPVTLLDEAYEAENG